MKEKRFTGPGGYYFAKSNPEEMSLLKDIENAFSSDYKTSMDFLGGHERQNFKKGGMIDIKHPGALHKEMGISEKKKIPVKDLKQEKMKAEKNDDKTLSKRVNFALNARKWNKG